MRCTTTHVFYTFCTKPKFIHVEWSKETVIKADGLFIDYLKLASSWTCMVPKFIQWLLKVKLRHLKLKILTQKRRHNDDFLKNYRYHHWSFSFDLSKTYEYQFWQLWFDDNNKRLFLRLFYVYLLIFKALKYFDILFNKLLVKDYARGLMKTLIFQFFNSFDNNSPQLS